MNKQTQTRLHNLHVTEFMETEMGGGLSEEDWGEEALHELG